MEEKQVFRINSGSFYIEPVIINTSDTLPNDCIDHMWDKPLYIPKWNGTQWIEGATEDQIKEINTPKVTAL